MNKMSETKIYQSVNRVIDISSIYKRGFGDFAVPLEMYKPKTSEFVQYKYPLSKYTLDTINSGKVIPIMFKDPMDQTVKGLNRYPDPIFYFPIPTSVKNGVPVDIVTYVNTDFRGSYTRDKIDKKPIFYNIDKRDLYCLLQVGAVLRGIRLKDNKISNASQFHKLIGGMYGELFAKAIDGNRQWSPTGGLPEKIALLKFLGVIFYLEQMVEKPKQKAIELALTLFQSFDKSYIESTCRYVSDDSYNITAAPITKRITKVEEFIEVVKIQFPELTNLNYSNLLRVYKEMYGDNALFCIEDFGSFISMLQLVHLTFGYYRDRLIMGNHVIEKNINEALKSLAVLLMD